MRIALFDGILEHHLHESLQRALIDRGHEVHATGRIGRGFRFPAAGDPIEHLERAMQECIEFAPDWLLCFRPASLPPRSLARLRDAGVRLAAWFSDDPVLFDLSYAPVLEQYDRIAHCGGTAVLTHYERYFGRPTGVNLPFWTDHVAFPPVWGSEPAESPAMFLGNVDDAVRRGRYFELGRMGPAIRIHGRVGVDHLGLWGGYLDSDDEVLVAGARTDWAVSIPQRFADHRGLETWFEGLDGLGSFQLPSRVVQCMAMGIPTISIDPDGGGAELYPELVIAASADEAREIIADPAWGRARLADRSEAVLRRFDRHFSAASRARALEVLLSDDDSWRLLDADGRMRWFAEVADREASTAEAPRQRRAPAIAVAEPTRRPGSAIVVSQGRESEEALVSGLPDVLDETGFERLTWQEVAQMPAEERHRRFAVEALVLCPASPAEGSSLVDELLDLAEHAFVPRGVALTAGRDPEPLIRFATVGELRTKAWRAQRSPLWQALLADARGRTRAGRPSGP